MIVKQPEADNALKGLLESLRSIIECKLSENDVIILYFSSHIITPQALSLSHSCINMLDLINKAVKGNEDRVICVVRTNAPAVFRGKLGFLHKQAIELLEKAYCYLKFYNRSQFINHAKFFIGFRYNINYFYYFLAAKYYGSTNFTEAGLAKYTSLGKKGNYEEFYFRRAKAYNEIDLRRALHALRNALYYVDEVYSILKERIGLYTDTTFLKQYYATHLENLKEHIEIIDRLISGTTLARLFQAYVNAQVLYIQTLSFISDLPGRILTSKVIERVMREVEPPDPLEVEALMTSDEKFAEILAERLGFEGEELRHQTQMYIRTINYALGMLYEEYLPREVKKYFDDVEESFSKYIERYGGRHLNLLKHLWDAAREYSRE